LKDFDPTEALPFADSPTQMFVGTAIYAPMRGCVVGNVLIWLGCAAAALVACAVAGRAQGGLRAGAARLGLPGKLSLPADLLLQPTAASSLTLFFYPQGGSDTALALLGLSGCLMWCAVWWYSYRNLRNSYRRLPTTLAQLDLQQNGETEHNDSASVKLFLQVFAPFRWLKMEVCEWLPKRTTNSCAERQFDIYIARFESFAPYRQWFLAVEIASAFAMAGQTAYKQSPEDDSSVALLKSCDVVISSLILLSCVAQPYNDRLGRLNYLCTAIFSLLASILVSAGSAAAAEAVIAAQVFISMFVTACDLMETLGMVFVSAARLRVKVSEIISSRVSVLWSSAMVRRPKAVALRQRTPRQTRAAAAVAPCALSDLRRLGVCFPGPGKPRLDSNEILMNLSIILRQITAKADDTSSHPKRNAHR
jgi:hypothetical protein